jgi:hypothetical protein
VHSHGTAERQPVVYALEPDTPVTLLEGPNGSGKTSLLNAVAWCLTGRVLRAQRPPEQGAAEFECRIEVDGAESPDGFRRYKTPAVAPMPSWPPHGQAGAGHVQVDTWVELTFEDDDGNELPPLRRALGRDTRGRLREEPPDLGALGLDPIAFQIGTLMPGQVPHIRLGSESDLGRAVAELTGFADLVRLADHARRVRDRLTNDQPKRQEAALRAADEEFARASDDLARALQRCGPGAPEGELPPPGSAGAEVAVRTIADRLDRAQAVALGEARVVLGATFDHAEGEARADLARSIGPARGRLDALRDLPAAARLRALASLDDGELAAAEALLTEIGAEAAILADLEAEPLLASRKRLYAKVGEWLVDEAAAGRPSPVETCPVCRGDTTNAHDAVVGLSAAEALREAGGPDAGLLALTITRWAEARKGDLAARLPPALADELRAELPPTPAHLIRLALADELFDAPYFARSLAPLRAAVGELCARRLAELPAFEESPAPSLPAIVTAANGGAELQLTLRRAARALAFARWRRANAEAAAAVARAVLGERNEAETDDATGGAQVGPDTPLRGRLAVLERIVEAGVPASEALKTVFEMAKGVP